MTGPLSISHGEIRRGGAAIIEPKELEIPAGATVGLVGLNGMGKSSWMTALVGALEGRDAPRLARGGVPVRRIAYLPQLPTFPGWLSVGEVVAFYGLSPLRLHSVFPSGELEPLLPRRVSALSGGEKQLLGAAIALGTPAELTLLDEPLSALDVHRRRLLITAIASRRGGSDSVTVVSTQVVAEFEELCDWFIVLHERRYAFIGSRDELLRAAPDGANPFESSILRLLQRG